MSACTCTNTIYELVRPLASYTINQNPTASQPQQGSSSTKTVVLFGKKLVIAPILA